MSEFDKKMEQLFDVSPTDIVETKKVNLPVVSKPTDSPDLQTDLHDAYQQSKENLQDIIETGKEAMEEILAIAKAGQHPRAFEVFGGILKNMVDANDKLLEMQKKMRDMEGVPKETNKTTIDKAIFVGSTTELQQLLKNNKK